MLTGSPACVRDNPWRPRSDVGRRCWFEAMEPRHLLAADPLFVGTMFVEEDMGSDLHGDTFEITFVGGARAPN